MINKNNSETKEFDPKTTPTFRTVTSNWEGAVNIVNWQNVCSAGVLRSLAKNSFSPPLLTDFFEDCSRLLTHSRYIDPFYRRNSRVFASRASALALYIDPFIGRQSRGALLCPTVQDTYALLSQLTFHLWDINKVGVASKYVEACLRLKRRITL